MFCTMIVYVMLISRKIADHRYDLGVKSQGQISRYLKSVLRLVNSSFRLRPRVFIFYTTIVYAWLVDENKCISDPQFDLKMKVQGNIHKIRLYGLLCQLLLLF